MAKIQKSELPYTVTKNGKLYVRKAVMTGGKQRQVWRVCEPRTIERVYEILREIEAEILTDNNVESIELARLFVKVREREVGFSEFKKALKTIEI
jgi:hypothetical protein